MRTVNIHDAKTHLSRLIDETLAHGEGFIIAKAGRPMVRVVPVTAPEAQQKRRLRFLAGHIDVPDDFDTMNQQDIADLFDGEA
jgi:antitoxin (DNA-binding transcriptional repressor) of toxin-antitoxin stability system